MLKAQSRTGDVPETFHLEKDEIFYFTYGVGEGGKTADGHRRDVNYLIFIVILL